MRPIDGDRLYNEILSMNIILGGKQIFHPAVKQSVLDAIEMSETLDYAPVKRGGWSETVQGYKTCSECGDEHPNVDMRGYYVQDKFCPNCGAEMCGKEDMKDEALKFESRLAQIERERDALMHDVSKCRRCETCAKRRIPIHKCPHFDGGTQYPCWQWRGVCPENTEGGTPCS